MLKSMIVAVSILCVSLTTEQESGNQIKTMTEQKRLVKRDSTAKGIFYRPVRDSVDGKRELAMRHRIVAARGGQVGLVPENFEFWSGDRMRLQIAVNRTGHVYFLHRASNNEWRLLFPDFRIDGGKHSITKGQAIEIPRTGWFEFDHDPGIEELYIFFAVEPIREFSIPKPGESLAEFHLRIKASIVEDLVGRHERQLRVGSTKGIYWTDKVRPASRPDRGANEEPAPTHYTASITSDSDGVVFRKISLRHISGEERGQ